MVLIVGLAGLGAGFALGRLTGEEAAPARWSEARSQARFENAYSERDPAFRDDVDEESENGEGRGEPKVQPAPIAEGAPVEPRELIDALRRHADSDRSQKMLIGMVADAARLGGKLLPEIQEMLEAGDDIRFSSYKPGQPGYPSLRIALLDAAATTGDPAAIAMIAEVAQQTESPMEVVFSAHVLDKLDALDVATAQRTLDSTLTKLAPADAKALGSILNQVIPAAAAADPAYAETILQQQIRNPDRKNRELRAITPMLDGLPIARAQDVVLTSMTAADVTDRAKYQIAQRAARRPEIEMMEQLRGAIESRSIDPKLARTIAANSVNGKPFGKTYKTARRALKSQDIRAAQEQAKVFQARLAEANKTIAAARAAGANVPAKVNKQASIHRENLDTLLRQIRKTHEQMQKQAAAQK